MGKRSDTTKKDCYTIWCNSPSGGFGLFTYVVSCDTNCICDLPTDVDCLPLGIRNQLLGLLSETYSRCIAHHAKQRDFVAYSLLLLAMSIGQMWVKVKSCGKSHHFASYPVRSANELGAPNGLRQLTGW